MEFISISVFFLIGLMAMRGILKPKQTRTPKSKEVQPISLQEALGREREGFYRFLVQSKAEQYLLCLEAMHHFKLAYPTLNAKCVQEAADKLRSEYFVRDEGELRKQDHAHSIFLKKERYDMVDKIAVGNIAVTIFDEVVEDLLEELEFEHLHRYNIARKKK